MMANKLEQLIEPMLNKPTVQPMIPGWLQKYWQRRALQAALSRAYAAWSSRHWEWVDYSFNEHFLTHQVAPSLIHCQEESTQPDPVELAEQWAKQFAWFDEAMRQRHIASLIPAICDFLDCLEVEWRAHPFRSLPLVQNIGRLSAL